MKHGGEIGAREIATSTPRLQAVPANRVEHAGEVGVHQVTSRPQAPMAVPPRDAVNSGGAAVLPASDVAKNSTLVVADVTGDASVQKEEGDGSSLFDAALQHVGDPGPRSRTSWAQRCASASRP